MKRMLTTLVLTLVACTTSPETLILSGPDNVRELERTSVLIATSSARATGVVIKSCQTHSIVLTVAHAYVVDSFSVFTFDGKEIPGCFFVDASKKVDLGLMFVPEPLPAISIAQGMPLRGSTVYTNGNKLGAGFWPTDGIYGGLYKDGPYHRASTPTHPGNSGGAVVYNGEVIGIVSLVPMFKEQLFTDMSLFISLDAIYLYLESIQDRMKFGETPVRLEQPRKKVLPKWTVRKSTLTRPLCEES